MLACVWVPHPFPPSAHFFPCWGGPSPEAGAQMLSFSGSLLGLTEPNASTSPGLLLSRRQRQRQRQIPSTLRRSPCSSLNCLQLGCIPAIMRCLRLNAVGSAGQDSRPEAQETGCSKHRDCPSWAWHPPGAPHSARQPQCHPRPHCPDTRAKGSR